jgi:beta-glucosidase
VATKLVNAFDGINRRAKADGIQVLQSLSNSADECRDAAGKADVVLVVAGTTSGESRDRENLHLDDNADELIEAAGQANSKTVVLIQAPGTVVMPWHESAAAILVLFLGGQETGSAWGDVLFGDHAPTGRLPLMIPRSEDDTIPPSDGDEITYAEGLLTSYRNPDLDPLFPFGHGLTYSTFKYGAATSRKCSGTTPTGLPSVLCIQVSVENEGPVPARCIPQLYVEFPSEAGYSAPILRGFQRSELLEVGATATVTFALSMRDLSHWDVDKGDWAAVAQVTAHIGESSGDIRQKLQNLEVADAAASEPQGHSDPYDCEAGFNNWLAGWSDSKKAWCCEHAERGCEEQTSAAPASAASAASDGEGSFCCFAAGGLDGCDKCAITAMAAPDSVCGASRGDCEACGGGSTWCPAATPAPLAV